ncbi:MAG: VacB/RNase II family 3'-5' exoribonuclease [Alphaproteobacteria bacterium]|nr:VacB/RNase II family 3'-5' exoribonuclease [Alphaproteobacteria bacterium]
MNKKFEKNKKGLLPQSLTLEISGESGYGDLMAVPVEDFGSVPKIYVLENRKIRPPLQKGDRFVANLINRKGAFWAKPVVRIFRADVEPEAIKGVLDKVGNKIVLKLTERNSNKEFEVENSSEAEVGDYVSGVLIGPGKAKQFRILKSYGKFDLNKATASLILEKYDIPVEFSEGVVKELKTLPKFDKKQRIDLTSVPFVTIDGEDSKDFDDAVYAEKVSGGFKIMVAIADVAFYVRPFSELDRQAYKRGNSVYLPNMVVPMLPEILSNDLCSLRPKEERASLVCEMKIDNDGNVIHYDFKRAVIKSAARLTYKEVQEAIDGKYSANIMDVFKTCVQPVYEAYFAFDKARKARGALELVSNEIKIKIDKFGNVSKIEKFEQLTAHKIIEEFMVAANVCAAKALKKAKLPVMYRIHESPLEEKVKDIKPLLMDLCLKLPDAAALRPQHFNRILEECEKKGYSSGISDLILRLQCQAKYSPTNMGHFGLGLEDYAHFTSPIRRYSDLLIHRALIKAYQMGDGGELEESATFDTFKEIGDYISSTERKAVNAERELISRFLASYLTPSVGQDFEVVISGVSLAGVFVRIDSIGSEGLIPMRSLPSDMYEISAANVGLKGTRTGRDFMMGDKIIARLMEASPVNGGTIFKFVDEKEGVDYYDKAGNNRRKRTPSFEKKMKSRNRQKQPKESVKKEKKKSMKVKKK